MKKGLIYLTFILSTVVSAHELRTVDFVELDNYLGRWYEIEKFPNSFQRNCLATQANYSLKNNGRIKVVNKCLKANGKLKVANGSASIEDTETNAKLKVSFFFLLRWFGEANYYILDLGESRNYGHVLIGSPDRNYAWILSRTPTLDQGIVEQLKEKASSLGFDASRFVPTPTWPK